MMPPTTPPSLVPFIRHSVGFSQLGAIRKAQKSVKRQLSSPKLVIFSFLLMLSSVYSGITKKPQKTTLQNKNIRKKPYF